MRVAVPAHTGETANGQVSCCEIAYSRFQSLSIWKRALAFHEKAGRCQHLLWLGKFISDVFLCPDIRQRVAGEAAVKAERSEFILSISTRCDGLRCR